MLIIAVRKEPNGSIYLDKKIFNEGRIREEVLSQPPYSFTKVEIEERYADCVGSDFNDDLTFNVIKYKSRKLKFIHESYEERVVNRIRQKYNINQELAILRQQQVKPEEYEKYSSYVEKCKVEAKQEIALLLEIYED